MLTQIIVIFLAAFLTRMTLAHFETPYILCSLYWGVCGFIVAFKARSQTLRIIIINLAVLFFLVGAAETFFYFFGKNPSRIKYSYGYWRSDDNFGWSPPKGKVLPTQSYYGDKLIWDVKYTINEDGWRVSPDESKQCEESALFFGCSFVYGEGLQDHETMPYLVGLQSRRRAYNFAIESWGPHQMLRGIEQGIVKKDIACKPRYAILSTGLFHVIRVLGMASFDHHGPKYVMSADSSAQYVGHFDDDVFYRLANKLLEKSSTFRYFIADRIHHSAKDIALYVAIVDTARKKLIEQFPGIEFHVIYWTTSPEDKLDAMILEEFHQKGITVHRIEDILPGYFENRRAYQIDEHEKHPNLNANKHIAEYVVRNILKE
jgi:hypothetical protein